MASISLKKVTVLPKHATEKLNHHAEKKKKSRDRSILLKLRSFTRVQETNHVFGI